MQTSPSPFHRIQILRSLPQWTRRLEAADASRLMQSAHPPYLDAERRPYSWYAASSEADQQLLREALRRRDASALALSRLLAGQQDPATFCEPLLQRALAIDVPVTQAHYRFQPFRVVTDWVVDPVNPVVPPLSAAGQPDVVVLPDGAARQCSLLAAAMHNFTGMQEVGPLSSVQRGPTDESPVPGLTVGRFVGVCRSLDLGQRYQAHLEQIHAGAAGAAIQRAWTQASIDQLRLDARVAFMSALLSETGLQALLQLCEGAPTPAYGGRPVTCSRLELFGMPLHDVLIVAPQDDDRVNPCIVHMPGDRDQPLREFDSLRTFGRHLARQLQRTSYRRCVLGMAMLSQRATLERELRAALFERRGEDGFERLVPRANPLVQAQARPLAGSPWSALYKGYLRRLRADAETTVVPTAKADAEARRALFEAWLGRGLDVLNVAAMVIPGLGQVMLAVSAAQVLEKLFHGLEAWEHHQRAEALAQVGSLLLDAIGVGVTGGLAAGLKASGFVDSMERILVDGEERLWHPDISAYRSEVALPPGLQPNESGQYVHGGRYHVRLDGVLYEQRLASDGRWRLHHPRDPQAYAPIMHHDGAGAWRLAHETVLDWNRLTLLRRLGPACAGLADQDLLAALQATGIEEAVLRRAHVGLEPPPALLVDALQRIRTAREVDDIIMRVRQGLPLAAHRNPAVAVLTQLPGWPRDHLLQVFEGSEAWGESSVYGRARQAGDVLVQVTRDELADGELAKVVMNQLDDVALEALLPAGTGRDERIAALQRVLAQALTDRRAALFDSLHARHQRVPGPAAQRLARQFTRLPAGALEEILAAASEQERRQIIDSARVPLRVAEEARLLQARARLDRALLGLHAPGLDNSDSQRLSMALLAEHPGASWDELFQMACANRDRSAALIGQQPIKPGFRSPLRLSHGRLGYPLSGRLRLPGWRRNEASRLQDLYPTLDRHQLRQLLANLRARGDVGEQLVALEREQDTLASTLLRWTQEAEGDERESRRSFSRAINRAWRQDGGPILALDNVAVEILPSLPARFDHVRTLSLRGIELRIMPADFLQSFPCLESLRIMNNPHLDRQALFQALRSAPRLHELYLVDNNLGRLGAQADAALAQLTSLRVLVLRRNALVLTDDNLRTLARLPLTTLDLRFNNITLDTGLAAHFRQMVRLRSLDLSINPLQVAPDLGAMTSLESLHLHDCNLRAWPEGLLALMQRPHHALRMVELSGNHITQVPNLDEVLASPYVRSLAQAPESRFWRFSFNDMQPQIARRLRAAGVLVFEHDMFADPAATPVDWLAGASEQHQALWHGLFDDGANRELREVVERVGRSAQARQNARSLGTQVWRLLQRAADDTLLRERLNEIAGDFPASCGDAGADAFSALEIELLAHDESATAELPGPYLFNFYRRLFRRDQVNALAARIHAARLERQSALLERASGGTGSAALPPIDELDDISDAQLLEGGVDDIEIRLALRQSLAEILQFPEPSQDMLYRETAQVSQTVEFNVEQAVSAMDADAPARRRWIAAQPAWQRFLRARHAERFSAVDEQWYAALAYLDHCLDEDNEPVQRLDEAVLGALGDALEASPSDAEGRLRRIPLTDQAYRLAVERVSASRQAALQALLEQLTAEQDPNR